MRFRSILLIVALGLVAVTVGALVPAIGLVVDRSVRRDVRRDLERGERAFEHLWGLKSSLYRSESRVVADEPRIKSLAATQDIDHATVLGVAQDIRRAMGQDLLIVGEADGSLLADVENPEATGQSLIGLPRVEEALDSGHAAGVWTQDETAFMVHARQIRFGQRVEGLVIAGYRIEDELAQQIHGQTGNPVVVMLDDHVIASSLDEHLGGVQQAELIDALDGASDGDGATEIEVGGAHYLAHGAPIADYDGERSLRFAVLRSLDEALAPSKQLKTVVYQIAGGALVLAVLLAIFVARRTTRPLDELVGFTHRIAGGHLSARAKVGGTRETRALGEALNRMVAEVEESREQMAAKERLEREIEIATRLQTAMLPPAPEAPQLEVAARMVPATEVGGDYYDVIPSEGSESWIAIGDVAGHGLPAGLVMFMAQVGTHAIVREQPDAGPARVLCRLNELLYRNVRTRLRSDEHMTFNLLKHRGGGRFVHAGAHEDIFVRRKGETACEMHRTGGTWLAAMPDITDVTTESEIELGEGDVMVLITDGMFEGRNAEGRMFGLPRLRSAIAQYEDLDDTPIDKVCNDLVDQVVEWGGPQDDDITLVVLRYRGE